MMNNNDILKNAINGLLINGYFNIDEDKSAALIIPECAISVEAEGKIYSDIMEFLIEGISLPLDVVISKETKNLLMRVLEFNEFIELEDIICWFNEASSFYNQSYIIEL